MTEETRKPGRPAKDKFVQAIEETIGEPKPHQALLAAIILPAIIAHCGPSGVKANSALAVEYSKELLTLCEE